MENSRVVEDWSSRSVNRGETNPIDLRQLLSIRWEENKENKPNDAIFHPVNGLQGFYPRFSRNMNDMPYVPLRIRRQPLRRQQLARPSYLPSTNSAGRRQQQKYGSRFVFPCLLPTGSPVPVRVPIGAVLFKMSNIASRRMSRYSPFLRQGLRPSPLRKSY